MIVFTVPADNPDGMAFMQDLYNKYSRLMFSEALRRVSNRQDCEDIVQDAVTSLCEKVDTLRELPPAALPAYIVYTVKNKAINFQRHQAVVARHMADMDDSGLELWEAPGPSLEDLAELRERMDGLYEVWPLLREDDQELLYRKYVLGQNDEELALAFHCRKDSVRMRLHRARQRTISLLKGGTAHDKARAAAGSL